MVIKRAFVKAMMPSGTSDFTVRLIDEEVADEAQLKIAKDIAPTL